MTPRQQRLLDAIRDCLRRESAVAPMRDVLFRVLAGELPWTEWQSDFLIYVETQSRNLVGVIAEVQREEAEERDAAVRALISEANIPRGLLAAVGEGKYDFSREAAADVARRLGAVLLAVVKHYPPESE